MVGLQLPKLIAWVRFPSPAPHVRPSSVFTAGIDRPSMTRVIPRRPRRILSKPAGALPGAAKSLPIRLIARVPLLGRLTRVSVQPEPIAPLSVSIRLRQGLSPRRLVSLLRPRPAAASATASSRVPLLGSLMGRVHQPIARTARVVRAAREVSRPQTRWERLREAALQVIEDPVAATRWEKLMGLGVGLVNGARKAEPPARGRGSALARILRGREPPAPPDLRARLRAWRASPTNEKAGPGKLQGRLISKAKRGSGSRR